MFIHLLYNSLVIILGVYINFVLVNPHVPILQRKAERWHKNDDTYSITFCRHIFVETSQKSVEALTIKII